MSRNGWGRCVAFVACMAVVALSGAKTARAQDQPAAPGKPVADVLPESTIALVEVHDIDATRLRGKDNILAKLLNDPQVAAYLKPLEDKINAYAQMLDAQMQANVQVSMNDIKQLLNGRVAVAVTDLSFLGPGPQPKIVVVITPKDTEFLKAFVARILVVLPPDARQTIVTRRVGNVEVSELATDGMGPPINWAIAGNTLVVGLGTAAADDVVQRMANGGPSLSANPTFARMREKLADYDQDWMYYISFDRVIGMIRAVGGEDAMKFLAVSGIGDLKALGAAAKLNGPAVDDRLYVLFTRAPAPGRLQSVISPEPLSADILWTAPVAADYVALSRFNVPYAYKVFTDILGEMSPAAYAEYQKDVEQADLALGISLEDDFFKAMGDEMMVYNVTLSAEELEKRIAAAQNPEQKGLALIAAAYENVIAVFTVTDSARIQKSMKAFADSALSALKGEGGVPAPEFAGVHFTDADHGGVTLHMLEGIPNFPLRPGYAVTAKQLIFAGSEKALASAVDRSHAPQAIEESSPVRTTVQDQIANGAGAVGVVDVRSGMELLMLTLKETTLPQVVPLLNQGGPPDPALAEMLTKDPLPAMQQALKANPLITVTTVTSDSDGVALTGHTMLGSTSFIVPAAAGAVGAGMLLPALARAREQGRRALCMNNLAQIGKGLEMWMGQHDGEMPGSLADLMPTYLDNPAVFRCPSAGLPPQPPGAFQTDYNYVGALPPLVARAQTILAYDKQDNHGAEGAGCLYSDLRVQWVPGFNLKNELQRSFLTIQPWADQQPADVQNRIKEFYQVAP